MNRSECEQHRDSEILQWTYQTFCPIIIGKCNEQCICLNVDIVPEGSMNDHFVVLIKCGHKHIRDS